MPRVVDLSAHFIETGGSSTAEALRPPDEPRLSPRLVMRRSLSSGADILRFLVPRSGMDFSPKDWLAALEGAGASSLAKTVAAALYEDTAKLLIPAGSPLEAGLLLDDLSKIEQGLSEAGLLPFGANDPIPNGWEEAAENAVALMAATIRLTRARHTPSPRSPTDAALEPRTGQKEKPPADSFQPLKVASKSADMAAAVDPMVIDVLTTVQTLRREHVRDSPFKSLTTCSTRERDLALPGELAHFLSSYMVRRLPSS